MEELYAIIGIDLTFPFNVSSQTCIDLANIWDCKIIRVSTQKGKAILAMNRAKFKMIFGGFPRMGQYQVPQNTEHFIKKVKVIAVRALS